MLEPLCCLTPPDQHGRGNIDTRRQGRQKNQRRRDGTSFRRTNRAKHPQHHDKDEPAAQDEKVPNRNSRRRGRKRRHKRDRSTKEATHPKQGPRPHETAALRNPRSAQDATRSGTPKETATRQKPQPSQALKSPSENTAQRERPSEAAAQRWRLDLGPK